MPRTDLFHKAGAAILVTLAVLNVQSALAQTLFSLGPGGRTIGGPGQEKPYCYPMVDPNSPAYVDFINSRIHLADAQYGSRIVCTTVANEGACLLNIEPLPIDKWTPTEWGAHSPVMFDAAWVSAGQVRTVCARAGVAGIKIDVICVPPGGAAGECPFSWRVDDGESR